MDQGHQLCPGNLRESYIYLWMWAIVAILTTSISLIRVINKNDSFKTFFVVVFLNLSILGTITVFSLCVSPYDWIFGGLCFIPVIIAVLCICGCVARTDYGRTDAIPVIVMNR